MKPFLLACLLLMTSAVRAQEDPSGRAGSTNSRMLTVAEMFEKRATVLPTPQEIYWGKGMFRLGEAATAAYSVEIAGTSKNLALLPAELNKRVRRQFGVSTVSGPGVRFVFTLGAVDLRAGGDTIVETLRGLGPEAYILKTASGPAGQTVYVVGNSETALWHGMTTVCQLMRREGGALVFPEVEIIDYPLMAERSLLVDVGGQGFMVGPSRWNYEQWRDFVDWMVDQKYNSLWIEFIGSGRLMGNLNMEAGEWIGFPIALKSYPQLVAKDRPIRRWDEAQKKVVPDTYTAPNVTNDFVARLIDYAKARGIKSYLFIGYDYFANQLPVVMKIPANDPRHPEANKVYDAILREITERYRNACGVVLHTIENKNVPPDMIQHIIRRTNEGYRIVRSVNPAMEVGLLADYLEWRPEQLEEIKLWRKNVPRDVFFAYSPHREPQQKAWRRVHGDVVRYMNYSQYAWDHAVYVFPERIREEILGSYAAGYRRIVTQAWYFDAFAVNYMAMAEYAWNGASCSAEEFWTKAMEKNFGGKASELMRTALTHTRFDRRLDIIGRIILDNKIDKLFTYWDMYVLHRIEGLSDSMLRDLEEDAHASLKAAREALPLVPVAAREMVDMTIISAERRLYLATSARHLLRARELWKAGDKASAREEMRKCVAEGEKLYRAATGLGIEFPLSVHDDEVVDRYRAIAAEMLR